MGIVFDKPSNGVTLAAIPENSEVNAFATALGEHALMTKDPLAVYYAAKVAKDGEKAIKHLIHEEESLANQLFQRMNEEKQVMYKIGVNGENVEIIAGNGADAPKVGVVFPGTMDVGGARDSDAPELIEFAANLMYYARVSNDP